MGRRKERRLAAQSAAGRRVKLDLLAEPSGDLGDSHANELEEDIGQDTHAGVPISSSSGVQQDNPLLLLGQYSDDELNEETDKRPGNDNTETFSVDQNVQVEEHAGGTCRDLEGSTEEGSTVQPIEQEELKKETPQLNPIKDTDGNEIKEGDIDTESNPHSEADSEALVSGPWTSGVQLTGDVISGWKLVMHEETNQYYYWNIETGETSWEVPDVLVQGTMIDNEQKVHPVMEEKGITPTSMFTNAADCEKSFHANTISEAEERYTLEGQIENKNRGEVTQAKGSRSPITTVIQTNDQQPSIANENHEAGMILSTHLITYAGSLLQRLKNLEWSDTKLQNIDWFSKYVLELGIRLSDLKALSAHGSSLLPFWMHSEEKLKEIASAIDEVSANPKQSDIVDTGFASRPENTSQQKVREVAGFEAIPTSQSSFPSADALTIQHDSSTVVNVNRRSISPIVSPARHLSSVTHGNQQEVNEIAHLAESAHKVLHTAAEDVDMDVDMEVDDETTANHRVSEDALSTEYYAPAENIDRPNPPLEESQAPVIDGYGAPPPPEEEWIPPPPPDSEPIPPPPPDEPSGPAYPPQPTYPEPVPVPYTDQYNMSYAVSGYEYYGPTSTGVPSTNYYTHNEEHQIADSQTPQYFEAASNAYSEAASNAYSEAASVMVNPMNPPVYYDLSTNGTVHSVPGVGNLESSMMYGQSSSLSYQGTTATDQMGALGGIAEATYTSLPTVKDESGGSGIHHEPQMTVLQIPATVQATTTIQAAATIAVKPNPPAPIAAPSLVAPPSTDTDKVQPKAMRSKKRTVAVASTLRSNKKVSSLVDKWKAAKEELHEDEPENAYELLEKKRQREIEKWRSKQIASGEAKDNANFQPLGGDWRERVKRKRARTAKEAKSSLPDASVDEKQKPDLTALSKDLPSGWQVYWDESTKEVYYGNVITSKTTWTRPTQ